MSDNQSSYLITDYIQKNFGNSQLSLLRDIILGISIYLFYCNVESQIFFKFLKYSVILLSIRYIISLLTSFIDPITNKRHFQISGHLVLFLLMIIIYIESNNISLYTASGLVLSFALLVIISKGHYTSDIISTILLTYYVFNLNVFKNVLQ